MKSTIFSILAVFLFLPSISAVAQDTSEFSAETAKEAESPEAKARREKTEALAMDMLRQTVAEIQSLRTPENRISLTAGLVEIMWEHDPDRAREMFRGLANSFGQLFAEYSSHLNATGLEEGRDSFFRRSDSAKATSRMEKALTVRENLARAAAGMDPILALEFAKSTSTAVAGGIFAERLEASDSRLRVVIVERYGAADPKLSREVGTWLLKDGLTEGAIAHLKLLWSKDQDQGAEYAGEAFAAAARDLNRAKPNFQAQASLLTYANEVVNGGDLEPGGKQLVSLSEARFQAEAFGREILKLAELEEGAASAYAEAIRPFSATFADRIAKKFSTVDEALSPETSRLAKLLEASREKDRQRDQPPAPSAATQADERSEEPVISTEGGGDSGGNELLSKISELKKGETTEEQRQEMVDKARASAAEIDLPAARIGILTSVAAHLKSMGDDSRALELVDEAEGLVTNQPKNYQDFLEVWMLAGGLVKVVPERSFSRLEDAIFRINDVINAGITIAEFIDVNDDLVQEGELLVGAFAGGMTSSLSQSLTQSDSLLRGLAESDFERAKLLTEKFDKPEIRILAKTLLLGVVLNKDPGNKQNGMEFLLGQ